MPRSMTGYARVQTETPEFSLTVSVKSVNHRFLDVQIRMPAEMEAFEPAVRRRLRERIARGALQVNARLETRGPAALRVDHRLVEGYLAAYRDVAQRQGITAAPDLNVLFRAPGVVAWGEAGGAAAAGLERALLEALDRALDELIREREREAAPIVAEMQRRSEAIDAAVAGIASQRDGLTRALAERLAQKLSEWLGALSLDPQRILQEAALVADRTDITEEIERLRVHNGQLRALLGEPGDMGKKLDFLLQEMNREANTIVSKTSGIGQAGLRITDLGLEIKAEMEKLREQGMNLE